jgi:hypothetical protein
MKTIEEVKAETEYGEVMTTKEFAQAVKDEYFIPCDGIGYFHDGEKETRYSVWKHKITKRALEKYPYVIWYNK